MHACRAQRQLSETLSCAFRSHLHLIVCRYYEFAKEHSIPLPTLEKKGFIRYEGVQLVVVLARGRLHSDMKVFSWW